MYPLNLAYLTLITDLKPVQYSNFRRSGVASIEISYTDKINIITILDSIYINCQLKSCPF